MMNLTYDIVGTLIFSGSDGITLYDYDWDSLDHAVDLWFINQGWTLTKDHMYGSDLCSFSTTSKDIKGNIEDSNIENGNRGNDTGNTTIVSESGIRGSCSMSFDAVTFLNKILKICKHRHVSVNGRFFMASKTKIVSLIINNNKIEEKTASFSLKN